MSPKIIVFVVKHPDLWAGIITVLALGFGGIVAWNYIFFWICILGCADLYRYRNQPLFSNQKVKPARPRQTPRSIERGILFAPTFPRARP